MLINNAGVSYNRDFLNLTPVEIEKTLSVNYMAHFSIIKEFLPNMIEKKKGHIVATLVLFSIYINFEMYLFLYLYGISIAVVLSEDMSVFGVTFLTLQANLQSVVL